MSCASWHVDDLLAGPADSPFVLSFVSTRTRPFVSVGLWVGCVGVCALVRVFVDVRVCVCYAVSCLAKGVGGIGRIPSRRFLLEGVCPRGNPQNSPQKKRHQSNSSDSESSNLHRFGNVKKLSTTHQLL